MKTKQLRGFMSDFLISQGAQVAPQGENLLEVKLPRRLETAPGANPLVFAFNLRGLQEDPRSELATVGNPVFDRILEQAREGGRVAERFALEGPLPKRMPDPSAYYELTGRNLRFGEPSPCYAPVYFLVYRIFYSLEDVSDELEVVPVDGTSLRTLPQTPDLLDYWESLSDEPSEGRTLQSAYPIGERVVRVSLGLLEKRLKKRLAKIQRDADTHLSRETTSIEAYYRQLIEETRNTGRRWPTSAGGREERIRLLQLDWKRRIEEAVQTWRPRVEARLSAVGAVYRPHLSFRVLGPSRSASARAIPRNAPQVLYDEAEKEFRDPSCIRCGAIGLRKPVPADRGFLCPRCREAAEDAPKEAKD